MAIGEICSRDVVFARRDTTAKAAAQLMREYYVGALVVPTISPICSPKR